MSKYRLHQQVGRHQRDQTEPLKPALQKVGRQEVLRKQPKLQHTRHGCWCHTVLCHSAVLWSPPAWPHTSCLTPRCSHGWGCPSLGCPPGWALERSSHCWELGAGAQQRCLNRGFPPTRGTEPQSWHLCDCGERREQGRVFSVPNWPVSSDQDVACGNWALVLAMPGHQIGL